VTGSDWQLAVNVAQVLTALLALGAVLVTAIQTHSTLRTNDSFRQVNEQLLEMNRRLMEEKDRELEYANFVRDLYRNFTDSKGTEPWFSPKTDREKELAARAAADGHLMIPGGAGGGSSSYLINRNKGYT
jgi:hypothetical protein